MTLDVLGGLNGPAEDAFLAIGSVLGEASSLLGGIQTGFATLVERLEGGEAAATATGLVNATERFASLGSGSHGSTEVLLRLVGVVGQIEARLRTLSKVVGEVGALAINAKIQASLIEAGGTDFTVNSTVVYETAVFSIAEISAARATSLSDSAFDPLAGFCASSANRTFSFIYRCTTLDFWSNTTLLDLFGEKLATNLTSTNGVTPTLSNTAASIEDNFDWDSDAGVMVNLTAHFNSSFTSADVAAASAKSAVSKYLDPLSELGFPSGFDFNCSVVSTNVSFLFSYGCTSVDFWSATILSGFSANLAANLASTLGLTPVVNSSVFAVASKGAVVNSTALFSAFTEEDEAAVVAAKAKSGVANFYNPLSGLLGATFGFNYNCPSGAAASPPPSSPSSSPASSGTLTVGGSVSDAYMAGCDVILDVNNDNVFSVASGDKICGTTSASGAFSCSASSQGAFQVVPSATCVDTVSNLALTSPLTSPAGKWGEWVRGSPSPSPLTLLSRHGLLNGGG